MGIRAANRRPPYADTHANAFAYQYADAYPDADGNPIANANLYPNPHADGPAYQHASTDGNAATHTHRTTRGKPANRHPTTRA